MTDISINDAILLQSAIKDHDGHGGVITESAATAAAQLTSLTAALAVSPSNPKVTLEVPDASETLAGNFTAASDSLTAASGSLQDWLTKQEQIQEFTADQIEQLEAI